MTKLDYWKERERQIAPWKEMYESRREEFEKKYLGEYIAIVDGEIYHSPNLEELQINLYEKLKKENKFAFVTHVGSKPRIDGSAGFSITLEVERNKC